VAVGLLAVALFGCSSKPEAPKPFATVNGEAISESEYITFLERKPTVQVSTPQGPQDAQVATMLGLQALRDLVNRKLILQLAKEDGILPTDADVEKELKVREEQTPDFVKNLTAQGYQESTIKEELRFALARERLQTKGITVPMSEVDAFIKENQEQFMEPAKASLQFVFVSDAKKKALVDKDLKAGQSFQTVAVRYSESPGARENGAAYSTDVVPQMPPQLQELVQKTAEKKATSWLEDGGAWVKFYVVSKTPAKKMDMTPTRKESLQRQLALQKGQMTNDVSKRLSDKLRAAKVQVNSNSMQSPWEKAFEDVKNQLAQQEAAQAANMATGGGAGAPAPGGSDTTTPPAGNR
jgi:hypothetical protein